MFTSFFFCPVIIIIWKRSGTVIFGTPPVSFGFFFLVFFSCWKVSVSTLNIIFHRKCWPTCCWWATRFSQDILFLSWATCLRKKTYTGRKTCPNQALTVKFLTRQRNRSTDLQVQICERPRSVFPGDHWLSFLESILLHFPYRGHHFQVGSSSHFLRMVNIRKVHKDFITYICTFIHHRKAGVRISQCPSQAPALPSLFFLLSFYLQGHHRDAKGSWGLDLVTRTLLLGSSQVWRWEATSFAITAPPRLKCLCWPRPGKLAPASILKSGL